VAMAACQQICLNARTRFEKDQGARQQLPIIGREVSIRTRYVRDQTSLPANAFQHNPKPKRRIAVADARADARARRLENSRRLAARELSGPEALKTSDKWHLGGSKTSDQNSRFDVDHDSKDLQLKADVLGLAIALLRSQTFGTEKSSEPVNLFSPDLLDLLITRGRLEEDSDKESDSEDDDDDQVEKRLHEVAQRQEVEALRKKLATAMIDSLRSDEPEKRQALEFAVLEVKDEFETVQVVDEHIPIAELPDIVMNLRDEVLGVTAFQREKKKMTEEEQDEKYETLGWVNDTTIPGTAANCVPVMDTAALLRKIQGSGDDAARQESVLVQTNSHRRAVATRYSQAVDALRCGDGGKSDPASRSTRWVHLVNVKLTQTPPVPDEMTSTQCWANAQLETRFEVAKMLKHLIPDIPIVRLMSHFLGTKAPMNPTHVLVEFDTCEQTRQAFEVLRLNGEHALDSPISWKRCSLAWDPGPLCTGKQRPRTVGKPHWDADSIAMQEQSWNKRYWPRNCAPLGTGEGPRNEHRANGSDARVPLAPSLRDVGTLLKVGCVAAPRSKDHPELGRPLSFTAPPAGWLPEFSNRTYA